MEDQRIAALIDAQPTRTSLDQAFYTDSDIYQRDVEQVYLRSWLYAGPENWFVDTMAGAILWMAGFILRPTCLMTLTGLRSSLRKFIPKFRKE